jgi:hypothetical protein
MIYLHGTIGYTIFINKDTNKKIIVFADMHDKLPPCGFTNSIKISEWFNKKFKVAQLLLEEVRRDDNMVLDNLWDKDNKGHTYDLQMLFIKNQNIIEPVDIRPNLILFSWEVIYKIQEEELKNIKFNNYLSVIIPFFKLKIDFLVNKIKYINKKIYKHFKIILDKFVKYIIKYKKLLNKKLIYIYDNHNYVLEEYNTILNDCMEWYICLLIEMYKYKTIMIHAGLYHTEKVNYIFKNYYKYNEIYKNGINYLNNNNNYECQPINDNIIM